MNSSEKYKYKNGDKVIFVVGVPEKEETLIGVIGEVCNKFLDSVWIDYRVWHEERQQIYEITDRRIKGCIKEGKIINEEKSNE